MLCLFVKVETGRGEFAATSDKAKKLWFQEQWTKKVLLSPQNLKSVIVKNTSQGTIIETLSALLTYISSLH